MACRLINLLRARHGGSGYSTYVRAAAAAAVGASQFPRSIYSLTRSLEQTKPISSVHGPDLTELQIFVMLAFWLGFHQAQDLLQYSTHAACEIYNFFFPITHDRCNNSSFCRRNISTFIFFFFEKHSTNANAHIHAHTLTPMNAHMHTLPLWAPPKDWAGRSGLEIDEVTTGASLSTGTSSPTERIFRLYKTHRCQTWGLNSGGLGVQPPS
jgi:hypothetical protein